LQNKNIELTKEKLMSKNLSDRAVETGNDEPDEWVRTAFNEIVASIYYCETKEEVLDKLIEDLTYYVIDKLDIEESNFNWQSIEEWHNKEIYNLASPYSDYLDFSEIKKIIAKSKISDEYSWEGICSKEMPIERINEQILKNFKETIDDMEKIYNSKEKVIEIFNFIEKEEYNENKNTSFK